MSSGGTYLALAYLVVLLLVLLYVGIIAMKLGRMRRDIVALRDASDESEAAARRAEVA
jgi:membrane protein required for beta-lactamase induction